MFHISERLALAIIITHKYVKCRKVRMEWPTVGGPRRAAVPLAIKSHKRLYLRL